MELEIDSSFDDSEYKIVWSWNNINGKIDRHKKDIEIQFAENHVGEVFQINVKVISNKEWHRYNQHDDQLSLLLK